MGDTVIRKAGLEDLDLLLQWRMEVLQNVFALPGKPSDELLQANLDYYKKTLPEENHFAVFAETDGKIVGCGGICFYQEIPSPDNPSGWCGYLMNIYTRTAVRGQGIGRNIVQSLLDEAARRGIHKVYLETTDQVRPLYKRIGFKENERLSYNTILKKEDRMMGRINLGQRAGITPTPMLLIGTYNENGTPNAMVATWGVTATWEVVELNLYKVRKTTANIEKRRAFTVSCVTQETLAQCDYLGTVSGKRVPDKLQRTGLTVVKSELVDAPYFAELPVTMECELLRIDPEEDDISLRILGTVKNVSIDERVLKDNGKTLDFGKLHPVCWDNFSNDYFVIGEKLGRWFTLGKAYNREGLRYGE